MVATITYRKSKGFVMKNSVSQQQSASNIHDAALIDLRIGSSGQIQIVCTPTVMPKRNVWLCALVDGHQISTLFSNETPSAVQLDGTAEFNARIGFINNAVRDAAEKFLATPGTYSASVNDGPDTWCHYFGLYGDDNVVGVEFRPESPVGMWFSFHVTRPVLEKLALGTINLVTFVKERAR